MMIDATGANLAAPTRSTGNNESLDQAAFLRLMSAQLQAQDPFEPMDQTQMVAQMAQFSQVAGTAEMNVTLQNISAELARHGALLEQLQSPPPTSPTSPTTPPETTTAGA
jgi:flagellar basal-body rod modification protein FlgD